MRLRNIPGAEEYLQQNTQYFIKDATACKGEWQSQFEKNQPLHAEFGSGKGQFIVHMAEKYPHVNFIGVEYKAEVLYKALKKAEKKPLNNLKLILFDVSEVETAFAPEELDRIYLNFVDPWHKSRHAKRRLTHRRFLSKFKGLMGPTGEVHFKTDNRPLFQFSLNEFAELDLKMKRISLDLAADEWVDNVTTEYEEKFMKKGNPIFRVEVILRDTPEMKQVK